METSWIFWIFFNLGVLILIILDLFIFHRKPHQVSLKEAFWWSLFWVVLSLLFGLFIWYYQSPEKGLQFFTGYIIEKSLSVDNIFLFIVIFSYFGIDQKLQHRLLFWGVLGALVMRAIMILIGVALVAKFHWILYIFGLFLIYTGIKFFVGKSKDYDPEKNLIIRLCHRFFPVYPHKGTKFFIKTETGWAVTPFLLALLTIETTDVIFALDSIPAIFAVTQDTFIIYTSNVGAVLGLRSLYFLLNGIIPKFIYLQKGIGFLLIYVGLKMLISYFYKIPTIISLVIIILTLGISIIASIIAKKNNNSNERKSR